MKQRNHNNISLANYHYGLAIEEIKLERSINNMAALINGYDYEDRPQYLINEISHQERELMSLRKIKSSPK